MKRTYIRSISIALMIMGLSLLSSCDSAEKKHPYLVININYSGTVDSANKLYILFYIMPNWSGLYYMTSSTEKRIVIPRLNIGTTPLYFEIVHDTNGDGVGSGDLYQGWNGVTDMTALLTPLVLPTTLDMVMINFNLDNYAVIP